MIRVRMAAALLAVGIALLSGCTRKANNVYVTSMDKVFLFSALDPKNGLPIFTFAVGDDSVSLSSPTLGTDTAYVGSTDGDLYALTLPGLGLKWKYHVADFTVIGTPAVENSMIYFTDGNGFLYAVEDTVPAGGPQKKWVYKIGSVVESRPTVVNGTVYFGAADGVVYAVSSAASGPYLKWSHQTVGGGPNPIKSSPAIVGDTLYIGAGDRLYAFDINGPQNNLQKWTFQVGGPIASSPAVDRSFWGNVTVYFGSNDHFVYAVDANKQILKWKFQTGNSVTSSPYVEGGLVYVGSSDWNVYALYADTNNPNGSLWWNYQTGSVVDSSPVAGNGMVFVGGEDHFFYSLAVLPKNPPTGDLLRKIPMPGRVSSPALE
jgi:outer membrane protein assembly factor BamB